MLTAQGNRNRNFAPIIELATGVGLLFGFGFVFQAIYGGGAVNQYHAALWIWLFGLALTAAAATLLGAGRLIVDEEGRYNALRFIAVGWTALVASAWTAGAVSDVVFGSAQALLVPAPVYTILGIALGAVVVDLWTVEQPPPRHSASRSIDIGKAVVVMLSIALLATYGASIGDAFYHVDSSITSLPTTDWSVVGLLGTAIAGFFVSRLLASTNRIVIGPVSVELSEQLAGPESAAESEDRAKARSFHRPVDRSVVDQLIALDELRKRKVITEDEFEGRASPLREML